MGAKGFVLPIIREEAARAGYTFEELLSDNRHAHIVAVRQYAMWRARKETARSWWEIGRYFHRDHTTIMHGYYKVEGLPPECRGVFTERPLVKPKSQKPRYGTYQGKPCRNGHDGLRFIANGGCVHCRRARERRRYYREAAE